MTCRWLSLQLSEELPVLFAKPIFAYQAVRVFEAVQKKPAIQVVPGMVRCPDLFLVTGEQMAIHADQE